MKFSEQSKAISEYSEGETFIYLLAIYKRKLYQLIKSLEWNFQNIRQFESELFWTIKNHFGKIKKSSVKNLSTFKNLIFHGLSELLREWSLPKIILKAWEWNNFLNIKALKAWQWNYLKIQKLKKSFLENLMLDSVFKSSKLKLSRNLKAG